MAKRNPAAVMGSLVNLKNVSTHKSLALTIHVPAEQAPAVLAAFGWPTMVDPVPVAVARLEEAACDAASPRDDVYEALLRKRARDEQNVYAAPPAPEEPTAPSRPRHWPDLSPSQQTGVIRNEWDFQAFSLARNSYEARDFIRRHCGVKSCADILPGTEAAAKWADLQVRYGNWLRERRGAA